MSIRYTDLDSGDNSLRDFVVRRRTPTITQLLVIFLSIILISVSISISIDDRFQMLSILSLLLVITAWYVIIIVQRNRDLVLATEFQNSLFASALGINNKFCLIIRPDGNIVYLDRSFQDIFPDFLKQPRRTVDVLLEQGKVAEEESNKIYSAIEQGVYSKVIFNIRGVGNVYHKMVVSIEPIMRPSGFILLRGREFVESRSAEDRPSNDPMSKSSITLFSHVMDTMNMGVYMTDPSGSLIYVNPVLEEWLGYRDSELTNKTLSLQDIISQGGKRSEQIEPDNYEGEVMLLKKTGGMMKSFINQKIIQDDNGKTMGCTALVHNFMDQTNDTKSKLW